ncbi:hypothetical protein [Paenibacillus methanolicus]|uniref:Uncharacterized protein n=1 Tax=Paenibacillus methanolicus TaxID=582686 RepID=A0A5S5BP51_9BACL|nr:hypothetical protein [Paenibacillus methanolicus]TYP68909.1 hypothetical protein BCM02_11727 [Paenibacillus methanolicus]
MAEYKKCRHADQRYRNRVKEYDMPPPVNLRESILEMRRVYASKKREAFVSWYANRYKVKPEDVRRVLDQAREANP